ncbi:MAG TPA: hypothetical protein VGO65_10490 [Pseudolysinimonas sp.]|nr:hypothetical protein [Pseudolysinimonas sp.]
MRLLRVTAPLAVVAVLALSACDPGGTTPSGTTTPEPTVSVAPAATPTSAPADPAAAPTCENIVSPSTVAEFTSAGIQITPPAEFAAKLASEGNAIAAFFDAGGVLCQTGAGLEANEIYGYAVFSDAQFAPVRSQFLADGYREVDGDVGVGYEVPDGMEGLPRFCYYRAGEFTICGNDDARVSEIEAILGLS